MSRKLELKRERDRRYRLKKKNDPEYKRRKIESVKKCNEKKRSNESQRDIRMRKKYERERKRKYRLARKNSEKENGEDNEEASTSMSRSDAAALRERRRRKTRTLKLKLRNTTLQRKIWKIIKAGERKKSKDYAVHSRSSSPSKMADTTSRSRIETRKALIAHYALMRHYNSRTQAKGILTTAARSIVVKYKGMRSHFKKFSIDYKSLRAVRSATKIGSQRRQELTDFFCRDDNSRLTSGKKETMTREKTKQQKRYLNFSVDFLFEKFKSENPNSSIGRTTFYKGRPFFVVKPKINDREQCLCIQCSNTQVIIIYMHIYLCICGTGTSF